MTWTTRILAILNVIAAIVLFWAAGKAAYQRTAWNKFMEERAAKFRDGTTTQDWVKGLDPQKLGQLLDGMSLTEELLNRIPEPDRAKLRAMEERAKGQAQAAKAAGNPVKPRYRSESEEREALAKGAMGEKGLDDPGVLLTEPANIKEMKQRLGPAGYARLIREAILLNKPKIFAEERELTEKLASLLRQREQYQLDIIKLTEDQTRLEARLATEKDLLARTEFENKARRSEITQLYAEVEEAMHARDVALGRETDMRRQLDEVKGRIDKLSERNGQIEKLLLEKEGVTKKE
jgi:hypothetical protein